MQLQLFTLSINKLNNEYELRNAGCKRLFKLWFCRFQSLVLFRWNEDCLIINTNYWGIFYEDVK